MNTIDSTYQLHHEPEKRTPSSELGKDEFLKILMTQLQNQDPLNPMDDKEFISQMATFSSLEQTMNIAKSIDTLVQSQLVSPVIEYSHMIDKTVMYQKLDQADGHVIEEKTSQVVSVSQQDGWAIFHLANGDTVYADAVIKVSQP